MSIADATTLAARTRAAIRDVPDFPKPGILFRDITPLLANASLFREVITEMARPFPQVGITHVIAVESRGFLFGVPVAQLLNVAFVPARKPGKLPCPTVDEQFALEYGTDTLSIHADAIDASASVLIVDDVLATGGTADRSQAGRKVRRQGRGYSDAQRADIAGRPRDAEWLVPAHHRPVLARRSPRDDLSVVWWVARAGRVCDFEFLPP